MSDNIPKKRIITPPSASHGTSKITSISHVPPVEGLLSDALSTIASELVRFRVKTGSGRSLDLKEARILQGYVKALVELSKEQREREKTDDLSKYSDEELLQLAEAIIKQKSSGKDVQG